MSDQRIPISQLSETQTAPDASYIAIDDGSLTKKITVENFNSTSTASAQQYANQAAASAQTVEDNIATSAAQIREATLAAREATQASTAATASATSAYDSASLAQNYSVNAATSAGQAMNAADTVAQGVTTSKGYAENSEAWAVGKRNGSDVPSSDDTYHNNAKYYSDNATTAATSAASDADRAEAAADSINLPDSTLTVSGTAADSKAAGDGIRALFDAYETGTASGTVVTFDDGASGAPLKTLTANIVLTQSGTGDPSPDNIRPITGYTGVTFTRTDGENPPGVIDTYAVTFPAEAGTVCSGTLTVNEDGSGTLVVDTVAVLLDGSEQWKSGSTNVFYLNSVLPNFDATKAWSEDHSNSLFVLTNETNNTYYNYNQIRSLYPCVALRNTGSLLLGIGEDYTTVEQCKAWLAEHPLQVVYYITPTTYYLTAPVVKTLLGSNEISMNASGDMTVTYLVPLSEQFNDIEANIETVNSNRKSVSDYITNNIAAGGYATKVDNLYINVSNKKFASTANALSVIVFPIEPNTKYTVHKSTVTVMRVATGTIASPVSGNSFTKEVHHDTASSDPLTIVSGKTDTYMYIQLFNNADTEDLKSVDVNMETLLIYEDKTGMVETELSDIEYGEITLPTGVVFAGFYPKADGTIGANTSSRMAVFPVKDGVTYLVSWLTGANMYRTAFGNTAPEDIDAGTPIYGYVDNVSTSHTKYPRTNDNNCDYLYIYIGNSAAATIDSIKVSAKIKTDIDDTLASEGDAW